MYVHVEKISDLRSNKEVHKRDGLKTQHEKIKCMQEAAKVHCDLVTIDLEMNCTPLID